MLVPPGQEDHLATLHRNRTAFGVTPLLLLLTIVIPVLSSRLQAQTGGPPRHA
jgi:hypothetical protein